MGDADSTVLGLLSGVVMIQAHIEGILPVWLGALVFSPFIVDTSVTITARILRGERFWEAHKSIIINALWNPAGGTGTPYWPNMPSWPGAAPRRSLPPTFLWPGKV